MAKAKIIKRSIRFNPDPGTLAEINFLDSQDEKKRSIFGLVVNESRTGCAAVVMTDSKIKTDTVCMCRIGNLSQTRGIIRWSKLLDKSLYKIGIEYEL